MPSFIRCFSEEWLTIRLCSKCVDILEKRKEYAEAIAMINCILAQSLFCQSNRGALYERLAIDYERYIKNPKMVCSVSIIGIHNLTQVIGARAPGEGSVKSATENEMLVFRVVVVDSNLGFPVRGSFFFEGFMFSLISLTKVP